MSENIFDPHVKDIAWCPGCGNFSIRKIMLEMLEELELDPVNTVMVSGIGQAAKSPQYIQANYFNGLHGRALPPATAMKAANPKLTVIVESGDGDMYGEGGNHFLHAIRRNPDITAVVHNNMIYGLTKGQASPTTSKGMKTPVQVNGVFLEPFNPIATAIALDASFVARVNALDQDKTKEIIKKAVQHKGFSVVDVFQICVSFNKVNTAKWFKEHTYYLDEQHDTSDRSAAFSRAIEQDKLPLGIFYEQTNKPVFEESFPLYQKEKSPLFQRTFKREALEKIAAEKTE